MFLTSKILDFQVINDISLEFSYVCLIKNSGICADLIFPIQKPADSKIQTTENLPYKSQLKAFDYTKLDNFPKTINLSTKTLLSPSMSESTFKTGIKNFTTIRTKIEAILEEFGNLQSHSKILANEQILQTSFLEATKQKIIDLSSRLDHKVKTFDNLLKTFKLQQKRLATILELLFDISQPSLSAAEIQWFQNLGEMYTTMETFYQPKLVQVYN
jgi:hypothetical protein